MNDLRLSVSTQVGGEFAIRLDSNPGTGAIWYFVPSMGGSELLREISEPHGVAISSAATQTFVFRGTTPGTHELRFALKRSWESLVLRHAVASVTIRPRQETWAS